MITLHHIPGQKNGAADALSQRLDLAPTEKDNRQVTILTLDIINSITTDDILQIKKHRSMIDHNDIPDDDLPHFKGKIVIPSNTTLR